MADDDNCGLEQEQINTFLLLVERGMDRQEAAYAVGALPSTFQKLQLLNLAYRRRMVEALTKASKERWRERNRDMSQEIRDQYLDLIADGMTPVEAAHELGTYNRNFKRMTNPTNYHYDEQFANNYQEALRIGHPEFVERLHHHVMRQIEAGAYPPLRDALIVHDDAYRQALSTKRIEIGQMDGDAFKLAAIQATANLSLEEVQAWREMLEKAVPKELEAGEPDLKLVSGDDG